MALVTTREELKAAQKSGAQEIIVSGELADQLRKTKKIASLSAAGMGVLVAAIVAVPFTGGGSVAALAPVAALTGLEIVGIITAASLGLGLILAIFTGYEEISFKQGELVLRKKSK